MGILCCKSKSSEVVATIVGDSDNKILQPTKNPVKSLKKKEMPAINVVQPTPEVLRRESLDTAKKPPEKVAKIPDKIIEGRIPGTFPIVTVPVSVPHSVVTPKKSLDGVKPPLHITNNQEAHENLKNDELDIIASQVDSNDDKQKDTSATTTDAQPTTDNDENKDVENYVAQETHVEEADTNTPGTIKDEVTEDGPKLITEAALVHSSEEIEAKINDVADEQEMKYKDVNEEVDIKVETVTEEVTVNVGDMTDKDASEEKDSSEENDGFADKDTLLPDIISDSLDPTLSNNSRSSDWSWPSVVKDDKPSKAPVSSGFLGLEAPMSPSRKFSQLMPKPVDSPDAKHVTDKFVLIPHQGK